MHLAFTQQQQWHYHKEIALKAHNSITNAQTTVVQKLNQTSFPKTGCISFRVSFFGSFLDKQKRIKYFAPAIIVICISMGVSRTSP